MALWESLRIHSDPSHVSHIIESDGGRSTVADLFGSGLDAICSLCGAAACRCPWCRHAVCDVCLFKQGDCPVCMAFCPTCARRLVGARGEASVSLDAANDYEGAI
jgi:hypothetical protein